MFISEKQRENGEDEIECVLSFRDTKKSKCWKVWPERCVCLSQQFQFCVFLQRGLWGWMELPSTLSCTSTLRLWEREQYSPPDCYSNPHDDEWGRARQEGNGSFDNISASITEPRRWKDEVHTYKRTGSPQDSGCFPVCVGKKNGTKLYFIYDGILSPSLYLC